MDVVLDKWDLREGQDAHAFMEQMVTDPSIKKVAMVCDRVYVEKADGRRGGVGTETQIISAEVYGSQEQRKFVALVRERDERGRGIVPVYYRSRIHIDFSSDERFSDSFEQLLRWAHDKPLHQRPELGPVPAFLQSDDAVVLATNVQFTRALDAVQNVKPHAGPALREYFERFAKELEKLRPDVDADPFDDAVVQSIDAFVPYRNQAIDIFLAMASYQPADEISRALHRFFEQLAPYMERPQGVSPWQEWDWDNFRFVVPELFLYAAASLLKHEQFSVLADLLSADFFLPGRSEFGRDVTVGYGVFQTQLKSLEERNRRLKLNRLSLHAELLKDRCVGSRLEFRDLLQADFVIFLHSKFHDEFWFPHTLLYADRWSGPTEIFARSKSRKYFSSVAQLLGINGKQQLEELAAKQKGRENPFPRWQFQSCDAARLMNLAALATKA